MYQRVLILKSVLVDPYPNGEVVSICMLLSECFFTFAQMKLLEGNYVLVAELKSCSAKELRDDATAMVSSM